MIFRSYRHEEVSKESFVGASICDLTNSLTYTYLRL